MREWIEGYVTTALELKSMTTPTTSFYGQPPNEQSILKIKWNGSKMTSTLLGDFNECVAGHVLYALVSLVHELE